jgi:hypothetical protein
MTRRAQDSKEGAAAAHVLVPILTGYAHECAKALTKNEFGRQEGYGGGELKMPPLPEYPTTVVWSSLPNRLAAGINDLRLEVKEADEFITGNAYYEPDPDDISKSADVKFTLIGWKAYKLAGQLRFRYVLGRYQSTTGGYHWVDPLKKRYNELNPRWPKRILRSLLVARLRSKYRQWKRGRAQQKQNTSPAS